MATRVKTAPKSQYATLHDLLILKLRVLHDVECELVKALPKMEKAASDERLKEAITAHLAETEVQETRISEALEILGETSKKKEKSEGIRGLIADAEWCIKNIKDVHARDASLIASARYVEHYKIAGYGTAKEWAALMGHQKVVDLLQETLDEETAADTKLTNIAESSINKKVDLGHDS